MRGKGWAALLGLFSAGVTGGVVYAFFRKLEREDVEGKESTYVDPSAPAPTAASALPLAPPLALPLRKTTPHGFFNAPRPAGSTPGDGKFDHYHQGIDLVGTAGEPVLAVGPGKIVPADAGIGETVRVLLLDDGRAVVYADLGSATVEPGTSLRTGDPIGTVRKNGFVHVAVRASRYGKFLDPKGIIPFSSPTRPLATS